MVNLKSKVISKYCPRCGGSIYLDSDENGPFEHCLQCGHTRDLEIISKNKAREPLTAHGRGSRR